MKTLIPAILALALAGPAMAQTPAGTRRVIKLPDTGCLNLGGGVVMCASDPCAVTRFEWDTGSSKGVYTGGGAACAARKP